MLNDPLQQKCQILDIVHQEEVGLRTHSGTGGGEACWEDETAAEITCVTVGSSLQGTEHAPERCHLEPCRLAQHDTATIRLLGRQANQSHRAAGGQAARTVNEVFSLQDR